MQPPKIVTRKGLGALWLVKCLCLDMAGLAWANSIHVEFMFSTSQRPAGGYRSSGVCCGKDSCEGELGG